MVYNNTLLLRYRHFISYEHDRTNMMFFMAVTEKIKLSIKNIKFIFYSHVAVCVCVMVYMVYMM